MIVGKPDLVISRTKIIDLKTGLSIPQRICKCGHSMIAKIVEEEGRNVLTYYCPRCMGLILAKIEPTESDKEKVIFT